MKKIFFLIYLTSMTVFATEYFVCPNGDNRNNGISREKAFRTIQHGGNQLKAGDILTIGAGEYYESVELLKFKGDSQKQTLIRAELPSGVFIRGDKPVSGFRKVPNYRFVYETDWNYNVNAVNEADTLKIYLPAGTFHELEFVLGRWFYDKKRKKLYISTTDGKPPQNHRLTVSVINGNGLVIENATNLVLDGIVVTGFYSHFRLSGVSLSRHGIYLKAPLNSIVRNCAVFFNSNGISLGAGKPENSTVENCTAYANGSFQPVSGGNIIIYGPCKSCTIRNSTSFFSSGPHKHGIRFYDGKIENCLIDRCISFGESPVYIKGINKNSWCRNTFSESGLAALNSSNNVYHNINDYNVSDVNSLHLDLIKVGRFNQLFADPDNYDFRPQWGKISIAKGLPKDPKLYFISPNGNDAKNGKSLQTAWKSFKNIKPDTTVYLQPGTYGKLSLATSGVTIKGRGTGERAFLDGGTISGNDVSLQNLDFRGAVTVSGNHATLSSCTFEAPFTVTGQQVRLTHNHFKSSLDLRLASGFRHSNILAKDVGSVKESPALSNLDTGSSLDALPLGPYRLPHYSNSVKLIGPFIYSVGTTFANIEWWTDSNQVSSELVWGESSRLNRHVGQPFTGGNYHSATITGLQPGKKYIFQVKSRTPLREYHNYEPLAKADLAKKRTWVTSSRQSFKTLVKPSAARIFHVTPDGNDGSTGMSSAPFRTISHALAEARAGDTVVVGAGIYREAIYFRNGGTKERPITLRNAPGEKVVLDGSNLLPQGIILDNKSNIIIDGFYFKNFQFTPDGAGIKINGGSNIVVQRCFYDGRSIGYTPDFIFASGVAGLSVANCVIMRGFHGAEFWSCPDMVIRNTVWYVNQIDNFYIHNTAEQKVTLTRNIIFDSIPMKFRNPLIGIFDVKALSESFNCYQLRLPEDERILVRFFRYNGTHNSKRCTYKQFLKNAKNKRTSLFVDPQISLAGKFLQFTPGKASEEWKKLENQHEKVELQRHGNTYEEFDFNDFFSNNPECIKLDIGLEPKMFSHFKFKR